MLETLNDPTIHRMAIELPAEQGEFLDVDSLIKEEDRIKLKNKLEQFGNDFDHENWTILKQKLIELRIEPGLSSEETAQIKEFARAQLEGLGALDVSYLLAIEKLGIKPNLTPEVLKRLRHRTEHQRFKKNWLNFLAASLNEKRLGVRPIITPNDEENLRLDVHGLTVTPFMREACNMKELGIDPRLTEKEILLIKRTLAEFAHVPETGLHHYKWAKELGVEFEIPVQHRDIFIQLLEEKRNDWHSFTSISIVLKQLFSQRQSEISLAQVPPLPEGRNF